MRRSGQNSPCPCELLQSPAEPFEGRGQQGTNCDHSHYQCPPQGLHFSNTVISEHLCAKVGGGVILNWVLFLFILGSGGLPALAEWCPSVRKGVLLKG